MIKNRKSLLPNIYGDTPSFLGVPVVSLHNLPKGYDVIVAGVPWEGAVTWGSFSSCELAPRTIRHAAARYGGFLPEYDIDLFDHMKIADAGDISVCPNSPGDTMTRVFEMANDIYGAGSIPFSLGGDHSFTPAILRALGEHTQGKVGIIHFDAHFDNLESFGNDRFPRCGPIYGLSQIDKVKKTSIVQIGIRGPRNSRAQYDYAKKMGATVFDMRQIREKGLQKVIDEAICIAKQGTERFYLTICSDCVDVAYNAGGPIDFNGLRPDELFQALFRLGEEGPSGLDYVEVYPLSDPRSISSHLAAWAIVHALAGMAAGKKRRSKAVRKAKNSR
jgi:guanidinopropionase